MYTGNHLYKRFKKELEDMGFVVEPMAKYPFAHVFHMTPVYKNRILTIPMRLTPFGYKEKWSKYLLANSSAYKEADEVGKVKQISEKDNIVPGYYYLKEKIKRRYYMLRNSQEFVNTITLNSKNRVLL